MEVSVHLVGTHHFEKDIQTLAKHSPHYNKPDDVLRKIYAKSKTNRVYLYAFQQMPAEVRPDAYANSEYTLLPVFINDIKVGYIPESFHKTWFNISRSITQISTQIRGGPFKSIGSEDVFEWSSKYDVLLNISYT